MPRLGISLSPNTVDDINLALPLLKEYTMIPIVQGPQGDAQGFTSRTVVEIRKCIHHSRPKVPYPKP